MYKYKVDLPTPNQEVIEFESKLHISMMHPKILTEGICMIYFEDANVALNLAAINELEINGKKYHVKPAPAYH